MLIHLEIWGDIWFCMVSVLSIHAVVTEHLTVSVPPWGIAQRCAPTSSGFKGALLLISHMGAESSNFYSLQAGNPSKALEIKFLRYCVSNISINSRMFSTYFIRATSQTNKAGLFLKAGCGGLCPGSSSQCWWHIITTWWWWLAGVGVKKIPTMLHPTHLGCVAREQYQHLKLPRLRTTDLWISGTWKLQETPGHPWHCTKGRWGSWSLYQKVNKSWKIEQ